MTDTRVYICTECGRRYVYEQLRSDGTGPLFCFCSCELRDANQFDSIPAHKLAEMLAEMEGRIGALESGRICNV